jgi:Pentapeptide repeats (8 copies)
MSEETKPPTTATTTDTKQEGLDDREPTPDRQEKLRAEYEANVAAGKAPYEGVEIRTRGELRWVMRERRWSGENMFPAGYERANLSGADLFLADLRGAVLREANLSGANLVRSSLQGANLRRANLSGANLRSAGMNVWTFLRDATLDSRTRLGDIVWNGVPLTMVNWTQVPQLGDEQAIAEAKTREERINAYRDVVRAYRQLATVLRGQGMNEDSDRYAYRAQVLQRRMRWHQRQWLRYLGSLFLGLIAGYGYRALRSFATYLVVVGAFAGLYAVLAHFGLTKEPFKSWDSPLVLSVTSFHGRVFFAGGLPLEDWAARVGAVEAAIGLLVEVTFIATFTQRFFAR